jgi:D-tyrosyl-tRNA(Tyr) deacylase
MRLLVRRVDAAAVKVNRTVIGQIGTGLVVYVGIEANDCDIDLDWSVKKILGLRVFDDLEGKMNLSVSSNMGLLVISQFTLWGNVKKGYRPSFNRAALPAFAETFYDRFLNLLSESFDGNLQTGKFGAHMKIDLQEDGPVTIWLDSKNKNY